MIFRWIGEVFTTRSAKTMEMTFVLQRMHLITLITRHRRMEVTFVLHRMYLITLITRHRRSLYNKIYENKVMRQNNKFSSSITNMELDWNGGD